MSYRGRLTAGGQSEAFLLSSLSRDCLPNALQGTKLNLHLYQSAALPSRAYLVHYVLPF